jgi:Fuc2NAc and GlcNAc transferase
VAILVLWSCKLIETPLMFAVGFSGTLIALVGLIDDYRSMSANSRLLAHFAIASFALYSLRGMPSLPLFHWVIPTGYLLNILALFYLVWLLNLYNFMDGIDGLAAIEAISVCLSWAGLSYLAHQSIFMVLPLVLAAAVIGFLGWNFPKARIFMGDAGSGFLGLIMGIFSLQAAHAHPKWFWCWLILLGVFIVDATVTLFFRLSGGFKVNEAHRTHAYQQAANRYQSHPRVTIGVLLINLLWLLPMASLVVLYKINGALALIAAYTPIILLALYFRAGKAAKI